MYKKGKAPYSVLELASQGITEPILILVYYKKELMDYPSRFLLPSMICVLLIDIWRSVILPVWITISMKYKPYG